MNEGINERGQPERMVFRLYPDGPHDMFAPSVAEGLVGTETRLQGRRVTITDAEPTGDGGLLVTVVRNGDLVDIPLFEGYDDPRPSADSNGDLSAGQRVTLRQAADITAGRHPLTRGRLHPLASRHRDAASPKDDPFTCGSCYFRQIIRYHNRSYPKCVYDPRRDSDDTLDRYARVAHSQQTDVRAWWPACPDYSPSSDISTDAARWIPPQEYPNPV